MFGERQQSFHFIRNVRYGFITELKKKMLFQSCHVRISTEKCSDINLDVITLFVTIVFELFKKDC